MTKIHPVILCGGSGSRLWPLSRKSFPKQFSPLLGDESLFQATVRRMSGPDFAAPLILTTADFRFIVTEQLSHVGMAPAAILIEPQARNTAPAVLAAALWLAQSDPRALMLIAPSDHAIPDAKGFGMTVQSAVDRAESGGLVAFGVTPDRPETGYGYLELESPEAARATGPQTLRRFVEKPDHETACGMLDQGNYLWNAGIFLCSAETVLAAYRQHAPDICALVEASLAEAKPDLGFLRLAPVPWAQLRDISFDYAIMEKAERLAVVRYSGGWSDLGGWQAVWQAAGPDGDGVVCSGAATALECRNSLLRSEAPGLELVGLGLDNIIVVAMPDAVLVADKSRAQEVREVVLELRAQNSPQADTFPRDHRPWGWFERIAAGDRFQVKRIQVHPGASLSLQSHVHRAEHWIVVAGTAEVTMGTDITLVTENQSVYIPVGAKHRLANPGKMPLILIEVQTGGYLGEDDIKRYEDVYART